MLRDEVSEDSKKKTTGNNDKLIVLCMDWMTIVKIFVFRGWRERRGLRAVVVRHPLERLVSVYRYLQHKVQ
jgi:hypothetical protein